jgi:hypothetical protein
METSIQVEPALGGNVKVTVTVRGVSQVYVWKMSPAEAEAEAEEIVRRKAA